MSDPVWVSVTQEYLDELYAEIAAYKAVIRELAAGRLDPRAAGPVDKLAA